MTLPDLLPLLFSAFVAEVAGTLAGFGSATVLTPVASLFMDIKTAIALVAFFHFYGNLSRVALFRKEIDWRLFRWFGAASVVTTLAGAFLVGKLSSYVVQGIFGVFLLLFAGLSAFGPGVRLPASKTTALAGGLCSGFIAGLIGTGGAVRAVFLLAFGLRKETYIATSAAVALVIDGSRIPVYLAQGFVTERWLVPLVLLFGVAWLGAWTGKRIVTRVPAQAFMKVVLLALAAMGMKLMWAGFAAG